MTCNCEGRGYVESYWAGSGGFHSSIQACRVNCNPEGYALEVQFRLSANAKHEKREKRARDQVARMRERNEEPCEVYPFRRK